MKKAHALFESRLTGKSDPDKEMARDVYDLGDRLLWVDTDRIAARGKIFPTPVPDKGRIATCMSVYWQTSLSDIAPNHLMSKSLASAELSTEEEIRLVGRARMVRKTQPIPYACIVRGYATGRDGGGEAPSAERLPEPVFTASAKGGREDAFAAMADALGAEAAESIRGMSLALYERAAAHTLTKGFILAETSFEFGLLEGKPVLVGEVLTPNSSLYWLRAEWRPGLTPPDFAWRDFAAWVEKIGWLPGVPPPPIPGKVVASTYARHHELAEKILGARLVFRQAPHGRNPALNRLGDSLVLLIIRLLVFFLALPPLGAARWLGRRLGDLYRLVDRRHRRRAEAQVADRLGLDPAETREFVKRNFRHYGMVMAEFSRLSRMDKDDFPGFVDYSGFMTLARELLAEGRGIMFITGHFGNWEWMNANAAAMGLTGGSIARPLDNPGLNEFVRRIRERNGRTILDKRGAVRKAREMLRENRAVGVLIDQDAGPQGMMSPFLGKPASTLTIPVEIAMRTGSPMVPVVLRRGGAGGKLFTIRFGGEVRRADPDADPEAEIRRLVDTLNADLGKLIMEAPDQWFWLHQRWKSVGRR